MSSTFTPMAETGVVVPPEARPFSRKNRHAVSPAPSRFLAYTHMDHETAEHREAERFYLQKQIQTQTPMIVVLEDGEQVEGCIEWYDRHTLKVRGRQRMLIFKSAIKYMYKQGENGV